MGTHAAVGGDGPATQAAGPRVPAYRPLNGWCLGAVAGAALGWFLGGPWWLWPTLAAAALGVAWLRRAAAPATLCLACLCLFAARGADRQAHAARFAEALAEAQTQEAPLPLRLTVGPDLRRVDSGPGRPAYHRFTAQSPTLPDGTPALPHVVKVNFRAPAGSPPPAIGQDWLVRARPVGAADAKTLTLNANPRNATLLRDPPHPTLRARLAALRAHLARNLARGVTPGEALYAQTMTLGADRPIPREELQVFADAGIVHVLSISGLHVGVVAALLHLLLGWAGLGPRLRAGLLIPLLVGYLLLIGAPPAAARATLMATVWLLGPCLRRKPDALTALSLSAALLLAHDPTLIGDVGALLSFLTLAGILLWTPLLLPPLLRRLRADAPPARGGPLPLGQAWRRAQAFLAAVSLSAWLAALPICLCVFGRVSLIGLLLNLVLPGLTVPVVWGGLAAALLGDLLPGLAVALNCLSAACLGFVTLAAEAALALPGAVYEADALLDPASALFLQLLFLALPLLLGPARQPRAPHLPPPPNPKGSEAKP